MSFSGRILPEHPLFPNSERERHSRLEQDGKDWRDCARVPKMGSREEPSASVRITVYRNVAARSNYFEF